MNHAKIRELIEAAGCKLKFLPPYSPDLNPIEKFWFKLKTGIKKRMRDTKEALELSMEIMLDKLSIC